MMRQTKSLQSGSEAIFLPNTLFNKIQCHLFASALEIVAEVGYL